MDIYEKVQRIKNEIGKYKASEIVLLCVQHLNHPDSNNIQQMRLYPPWLLLLMIKWSLLYGVEYEGLYAQPLKQDNFNRLVNSFHELSDLVRMPSEYSNVFLFLRNMAYQQFWLQEQLPIRGIARQQVIFGNLPTNHPFQRDFFNVTGVEIKDFLELAVITLSAFFIKNRTYIAFDWYKPVLDKYGTETIKRFLSSVSLDITGIRRYLHNEKNEVQAQSLNYEFYERSPLKRYPLLDLNGNCYCYHRNLLAACFESLVYDTLRRLDPNTFMDKFGDVFQNYVEKLLATSGIDYASEAQIQTSLMLSSKCVDFLIFEDGGTIFIDAKGVEMSRIGMLTHQPHVVSNRSRSSIVKGISQGYELAQRLTTGAKIGKQTVKSSENYLLIVTFSEFYVGNGEDFYNYIDKEKLDAIVKESRGRHWIPFQHMYFLSVGDFETFLECARQSKKSLVEILRQAVKADRVSETRKLTFGQHIASELQTKQFQLPLIQEALNMMLDELKTVLAKYESSQS